MASRSSTIKHFLLTFIVSGALLLALSVGSTFALIRARNLATETVAQGVAATRASQSALARLYELRIADQSILDQASPAAVTGQKGARIALTNELKELTRVFGSNTIILATVGDVTRALGEYDQAFARSTAIVMGGAELAYAEEVRDLSEKKNQSLDTAKSLLRKAAVDSTVLVQDNLA